MAGSSFSFRIPSRPISVKSWPSAPASSMLAGMKWTPIDSETFPDLRKVRSYGRCSHPVIKLFQDGNSDSLIGNL